MKKFKKICVLVDIQNYTSDFPEYHKNIKNIRAFCFRTNCIRYLCYINMNKLLDLNIGKQIEFNFKGIN